MKKLAYSSISKAIAFMLVLALTGIAVGLLVSVGFDMIEYNIFEDELYDDFNFSQSMSNEMASLIDNIDSDIPIREPDSSIFEYYISVPGKNILQGNPSLLEDTDFSSVYKYSIYVICQDGKANTQTSFNYMPKYYPDFDCEIFLAYTPAYAADYTARKLAVKEAFEKNIYFVLFCAVGIIFLFVYLLFVCGRDCFGRIKLLLQDKIPPELQLAAAAFLVVMGGLLIINLLYFDEPELRGIIILSSSICASLVIGIVLCIFMSFARLGKNGTFLRKSLIVIICVWGYKTVIKILKFCFGLIGKFFKTIIRFFKQLGIHIHAFFDVLLTYRLAKTAAAVIVLTGGLSYIFGFTQSFFPFLLTCALIALVTFKLLKAIKSFEVISNGIHSIKNGEINQKILLPEKDYFHEIADSVNSIGDGIQAAVEKSVKAEKLKTELITNVSHDLKTPLTSIISYSDLLCDMKLSPNEANEYAKIIRKKGERLKNLTQDLFDMSKAQSGNEQLNIERLDLALLINQSLGESDSILEKSGLVPVIDLGREMFISGDGKKLSRVFENLIVNISKYAQKSTRVFISIKQKDNNIYAEFKNTSAAPLDFDTEEITERFVRGDKSRSTEGSGLGLAIAKSYTELCGGSFRVETDGDLFKVILTFKKA